MTKGIQGASVVGLPEDPPGPFVTIQARQAAEYNGYRLELGAVPGGWLHYGSTTANGHVWIAGRPDGPWFLSVEHAGVAAELSGYPPAPVTGPGAVTCMVENLTLLHETLDRVYKLAMSLPDAPLARFDAETAALPRITEAERLVVQRVGQNLFRDALLGYWGGRCVVTGLAVPDLLRASHIKPWADCAADAERLDVFNGLLLAPHLDMAFDRGFLSVADDGTVILSSALPQEAAVLLGLDRPLHVHGLCDRHRHYLPWHRERVFRRG